MTKINRKTSTAIIVRPPQKQNKKQKNKKRNKNKPSSGMKMPGTSLSQAGARAYALALGSPFHKDAVGAKVPDLFSGHTSTYSIKRDYQLTTTGTGTADFVIFPNIAGIGASTKSGMLNGDQNFVTNNQTVINGGSATINPSATSTKLVNYRIVGYGVRITSTTSMTNSQGKVVVATFPISSYYASQTTNLNPATTTGITPSFNGVATVPYTWRSWGVPISATNEVDFGGLVNYSDSRIFSMLELGERTVEIIPKLCSPEALDFRPTVSNATGSSIVTTGGITPVYLTTDDGFLRLGGFEAVAISLQGGPANTSALDVEIIYHIEGCPNISDSTLAFLVPETISSPVDPLALARTQAIIAMTPTIKVVTENAASWVHPILGNFVKGINKMW